MKKKRIIFITLGVIIVLTIGHFALSKPVYTLGAKLYLANKYSWNIKDIETVKYQRDYIEADFGFLFLDSPNDIDYYHKKWVFKYKEREFNVEHYHLHYADDYQLEDIFKWCTEYLQKNVDKDVVGVEVDSNIIYRSSDNEYRYNLPWDQKKVFTKRDAKELLSVQSSINDFVVFYRQDNILQGDSKNHSKYRKQKQMLLSEFGKTNIVIIEKNSFKRDSIGVTLSNRSQTRYSVSNSIKYICL